MRRIAAAAGALCVATLGCAAPSRHLTSRQVDDPLVLPRGLASFSALPVVSRYSTTDRTRWDVPLVIRFGFTDRLELRNTTLAFAFLDDAPLPAGAELAGKKRGPFSLGARAGFLGIGYSSIEGMILLPVAAAVVGKHLGSRTYVWSELGWTAGWRSSPRTFFPQPAYSTTLWPTGNNSRLFVDAGAHVQLVDRWALAAGVGVERISACVAPTCDWAARGAEAFLGSSLRVRYWLDLALFGVVNARERPAMIAFTPTPDPPVLPPRRAYWISVSAAVTVRW